MNKFDTIPQQMPEVTLVYAHPFYNSLHICITCILSIQVTGTIGHLYNISFTKRLRIRRGLEAFGSLGDYPRYCFVVRVCADVADHLLNILLTT